jgi:hypothetical protein
MKKWGIAIVILLVVGGLYVVEFSKIQSNETTNAMPTLDVLEYSGSASNWEHFYKVRATILDGQTATFDIPEKLKELQGKEMEMEGAAVFFSPGCQVVGDKIAVHSFFLYPTLGLANACVHLPEVKMRWTIRINLSSNWELTKTEMIDAKAKVKGTFRIDTSKPYESAFFLDNASVERIEEEEM